MAADLRNRIARAISAGMCDGPEGWADYIDAADAVLAELGLRQPKPVGEVWVKVIPENWGYTPREEITKVRWTGEEPPAGTKLYTAPQPQAEPIGDAPVYAAYKWLPDSDWGYCPPDEKFRDGERPEVFVILSAQAAPPSPQASAEDVELVGLAIKEHAARYPGCETENAWHRSFARDATVGGGP
jgi:hypothetical protein